MSYILVATDFTATGDHAVDYAAQLAMYCGHELCIVHFYYLPITFGEVPVPEVSLEEIRDSNEETMGTLVGNISANFPSLKVHHSVMYDDLSDGIADFTQTHGDPLLVVIGNSLAGESFVLMDSNVINTFRELKYPVLAVPEEIDFFKIMHICFAFDNKPDQKITAPLEQLKRIVKSLKAGLFVYHAQKDGFERDNLVDIDPVVLDQLAEVKPLYRIEYDVNLAEAMNKYVKENSIDWVAVLPHHYSFFESIFHRSKSKELAERINVPILILHE